MAPKVLRRPGGRLPGSDRRRGHRESALRRPASREEEIPEAEEGGMWRPIPELTMEEIGSLDKVVVEGRYWEAPCIVAGVVNGLNFRGGDRKLSLWVTGTQTESLLKAVGGRCKELELHLCGRPCEAQVWNNQLIHGDRVRRQMEPAEGWWTNLEDARGRGLAIGEEPEAVDQLAKLRTEMKKVVDGVNMEDYSPEGGGAPVGEGDKDKVKAKKKVKKKEKTKVKACLEMPVKDLFNRTGVDPDPQVRKALMRKARKIRRGKKKKTGSRSRSREKDEPDSDSTSSTSSLADEMIGSSELFEAERRALQIWKRIPGALSCGVLQDMRQSLMTAEGFLSASSEGGLPPVATQYYRQHLQGQVGPVMGREMQHWCLVIDLMLRGRPAAALDVASQRIKSLEQIAKGVQADIARRLELVGPEKVTLVSTNEASEAGKEVLQEERIQYRNSRGRAWEWQGDREWHKGGKGKDKDKGRRDKGKGEGKSKGDRDRGKGKGKREEDKEK